MRESGAAVVLFAGMGGASVGLERAGVRVRLAVDGWSAACIAHRRWIPDAPVVRARCEAAPINGTRPWLLWASPSCKPYSMANRTPKRGRAHPEWYDLALLVRQQVEMGARWLVMENVGGLAWSREGKVELARMCIEAQRLGLCWMDSIVNSNTVGVAQIRRRLFVIVGPEYVKIPHGTDYIPPEHAETPPMACEGTKGSWERETRWPKRCLARGIVDASPPSRRGVAHPGADEATFTRRPPGTAARTLAECCALQQVPLEVLAGFSKRVAYELCGNAVPPPLVEHVARVLTAAGR